MARRWKEAAPALCADPHPVVGDAVEVDQLLLAEHGDRVGQQPVEHLEVLDAEIREGVVVDRDATAEPAEGVVVVAEPGQRAGRADALQRGVEPEGHAEAGVDGGTSRPAFAGADRVIQGLEVQPRAEVPDDAGLMIGLEQILQGQGREDLLPVGLPQARGRSIAHDAHRWIWTAA